MREQEPVVLAVDQDPSITHDIQRILSRGGVRTITATSSEEALAKITKMHPKLITLEPEGFDLDHRLITQIYGIPVQIVSSVGGDERIGQALKGDDGADDYLVKPLDERSLLFSVNRTLRMMKTARRAFRPVRIGELEIDPLTRRVRKNNELLHLRPLHWPLVKTLAMKVGLLVSYEELKVNIWDSADYDNRSVQQLVSEVRAEIEDDPKHPKYLKTIKGFGYMLRAPKPNNPK